MKRLHFLLPLLLVTVLGVHAQNYTYKGGRDANTGLTRVGKNGKYGYIDDVGREIVPVIYDDISDFGDGKRPAAASRNGKWGYVNTNGKELTEFKYEDAFSFDWSNNLAPVYKKSYNGYAAGYVSLTGAEKIYPSYEVAMPFSDGMAAVRKNDKYGFINEFGSLVISCKYDEVKWGFIDGYAWVKKGDKWGMIDKTGKAVSSAPFIYKSIQTFDYYDGSADVVYSPYSVAYFDKTGKSYPSSSACRQANEKKSLQLATVDWQNTTFTTDQPSFQVRAGIKSKSKIESINVAVEGQRGIAVVANDGYNATVNRSVNLAEGPNKVVITVSNAAGTSKSEKVVTYNRQKLPEIAWETNPITVKSANYQVTGRIKSDSKLQDVYILINGEKSASTTRGINVVVADGYDLVLNQQVTLSEGMNTIKIFARNSAGPVTTQARNVVYQKEVVVVPSTEKRLALVMGNSNYHNKDMSLSNPVNDATDFANKLKKLGFDVICAYDKTHEGMDEAIDRFTMMASKYDVCLFFYAGHGMMKDNADYLIPTDAQLKQEARVPYECVPKDMILDAMAKSGCPMKIVILDACRNNPITRSWARSIASRGLAGGDAPSGFFVAYSTKPREVALDGFGRNSPYMSAILTQLDIPGQSLYDFFQDVSAKVEEKTNSQQVPVMWSAFRGKFIFNKK